MTDIVERLRDSAYPPAPCGLMLTAADEIERLEAEVKKQTADKMIANSRLIEVEDEIERLRAEIDRLKNWYAPQHSNLLAANQARIPQYSKSQVRQVGRQKINFTPEQKAGAREILRKLGLI